MPEELVLTTGRDSTAIVTRLRELGATVSYAKVVQGEVRGFVRLPDDADAADSCRSLISAWNRGDSSPHSDSDSDSD